MCLPPPVGPTFHRKGAHARAIGAVGLFPGTPPFTLDKHPGHVDHRPDLERSAPHPRVFRHELDRVVQIPRFQNEDPADLLLRLRVPLPSVTTTLPSLNRTVAAFR